MKGTAFTVFAVCAITCLLAGCRGAASTFTDSAQSTFPESEIKDELAESESRLSKKSKSKSKNCSIYELYSFTNHFLYAIIPPVETNYLFWSEKSGEETIRFLCAG